jgi:iron complex outermembrane receptor protein
LTSASFTSIESGDFPVSGVNFLGRWKHINSNTSDARLQWYYDRTERQSPVHREIRDTFDLEFQHRFALAERQDFVWGAGYRLTADRIGSTSTISFQPSSRSDHLFSAFAQNDITLIQKRLRLTLGSKFEHNDYTGFELQPNVRLLWTPYEQHAFWGAVSRAVRTPARFEHFVSAKLTAPFSAPCPVPFPCETTLFGNRDFKSEDLIAYEVGYRAQLTHRLSVDIATFYNVYKNLLSVEPGTPFLESTPAPFHLVIPVSPDNKVQGHTYGIEFAPTWRPTDNWKLSLGYTFLKMHLKRQRSSNDPTTKNSKGDSPQNQFHLRSFLDLPYDLNLDLALYYVDSLPNQSVPSYIRVDSRLGWHLTKDIELSVAVQNLFDRKHAEFGPSFLVTPTKIERSVYGKITWRF